MAVCVTLSDRSMYVGRPDYVFVFGVMAGCGAVRGV